MPILGGILGVVLVFFFPLILNKSIKFFLLELHLTETFVLTGTANIGKPFGFLLITPFLGLLSLGLLTPLISKSYYSYFANSHSYGTSIFFF